MPLFGNLSKEDQDRAIAPSPPGTRKVVLATSIAETSLTIDGVRVVIDAGLMRVPRFSPRTGMSRLATVPVSRASADQRRGRAGRTAPGVCYRLWTRAENAGLVDRTVPEILASDLAPFALDLAAWGVSDPSMLQWIDAPPPAAFAQARELLEALDVISQDGTITEHGRRVAGLPVHPRLGHMLLRASADGHLRAAALLAALLVEKDILRAGEGPPDPDLGLRFDVLESGEAGRQRARSRGPAPALAFDHHAVHRVLAETRQLERKLSRHQPSRRSHARTEVARGAPIGAILALAYPDRVGRRRAGAPGRFVLRNGRGASVPASSSLAMEDFIVVADADGHGRDVRVLRAASISEADVRSLFVNRIIREQVVDWDAGAGTVRPRSIERLGGIVLSEAATVDAEPALIAGVLAAAVLAIPDALPWTRDVRSLQQRIGFLRTIDDTWPDVSDAALAAQPEWLSPWLAGMRSLRDVQSLDLAAFLLARLDARQRSQLDRLAPAHFTVPSGSNIRIDYSDPGSPVLAVRLQEVFGLAATPRIADGRVPLVLHLLSPAGRPVQITRDLDSFWANGYFQVRKDLRGRYPKHAWPDDPSAAPPSRGPGRRH
jgi:ATP-dependent helicase HrpB